MRHSKDQDFKYLEESSSTLLNVLRADEGKRRDLDEQFKSRDIGHHRYFVSPYRRAENEWGSMFDVKQMIPLPKIIQDDLNKQVHTASFMGIIPEINRAWVTIDSKIMFWNYLSTTGGQPEVDRYDGLSDVIVSVSLSAPKSGVFLDIVKYVLVIATTVEVVILAVSWSDNSASTSGSGSHDLKIIPTAYTIASDNITMFKVIGSQSGRIFMGGQDGLLYELGYDHRENKLARLLGFESAGNGGSGGRGSGGSLFEGGGATKCQKLNHNAWSWRAILPPFIRSLLLGDESLTDLVVDDFRHLLYAVTSTNNIRVVYLGLENKATVCLINSFSLMQGIKYFLSYTGRNLDSVPRMDFFQDDVDSVNIVGFYIVPITESQNVHAVVVLQSGTRIYLQLNTWSTTTTGSNISTTASGSHVSNGYNPNMNNSYSNTGSNNNPYANINRRMFGPYHPTNNHTHTACQLEAQDAKLEIVFIRGPPTQDTILDSLHSLDATHDIGYLPANTLPANKENKMKISASYYAHGVFLTAVNNKDSLLPDELLGVGEDLTNRKIGVVSSGMTGGSVGSGNVMNIRYDTLLPSLRESVSIINSMQGKQMLNYKIFDIKESCRPIVSPSMNKYAPFYSLYFSSASPVAIEIKEQSSFRLISNGGIGGSLISSTSSGNVTSNVIQNVFKSIHNVGSDGSASSSVLPPLCYSSAVAPSGSSGTSSSSSGSTLGVTKTSQVSHVTPLTEFTLQSMPIPNQRQFLCLTRYGIIVIAKNRPIDYLSKLLLPHDGNLDHPAYYEKMDYFFRYFGHEESCAMCLELICGVPDDVLINSGSGTENIHSLTGMTGSSGDGSSSGNSKILRDRALRVILRFGGCPGFETIGRDGSSGGGGLSDSRLSAGTLTPNFFFSHKHDAVLLVCSRLLRPIWLRPVVDNKNLAVIWTPYLISTMKSVIEKLLHFLRDFYPTAVTQDVFMISATERFKNSNISTGSGSSSDGGGESDMSYVNSGLLTERLARQQATTILDPMRQFQKDASDREDVSIHSIWRLLHRADQALTLLQILLVLQNIHKIPINWSDGIGHNTTFRSLVVSPNIHDKIKKLLHTVIHTLTKSSAAVTASASKIDKRNEPVADDVTKKLTEDCYLYFSIGDRYAYEAARYLETIRAQLSVNNGISCASGSRQQQVVPKQMLKSQTDGLIYLLLKASKYWVSLADVKDKIPTVISTNGTNGNTTAATNGTKKTTASTAAAVGASSSNLSQLTLYCNMLSQLGSVGGIGIVHLCLSVAQNFDAKISTATTPGIFSPLKITTGGGAMDDFSTGGSGSDWERQLYHMGQILTDEEKKEGRELCYHCLIRCFEYALASTSTSTTTSSLSSSLAPLSSLSVDEKTAGIMIDEILANSTDPLLRDMVYNTLLKLNFEELLQIESVDVQDFLAGVDAQLTDSDCLYRYYESHGMHREAANYIYSLAHAEDTAVTRHVEQRLKFLQLAVDSATRACEFPIGGSDSVPLALTASGGGVGGESMLSINQRTAGAYTDFLREVKDEVIILGYQIEAYQEVVAYKNEYFPSGNNNSSSGIHDHQQQQDEMTLIDITSILNNLERKCMPISELFNDVLLPFHLWTLALCVLKHSGLDAPVAVQKLWKSIIYRKIPLEALTAEGKSFLSQQRAPDSIFIDPRYQCRQGYFENTSYWLSDLESSIHATGLKLYNHHIHGSADSSGGSSGLVLASHMFYAEKLLELLEELSIQLTICGNPVGNGWAVRIFLQFPPTSFSYAVLVDMYVKLLENWIGSPIERILQVISSLTFVLSKWVNIVYERNRSNESDRMQLIQTIRSGYLHEWLNKTDRQINLMRASSTRITDTSQERLTDAIETVAKIRKMISDFTT